MGTYSPLSEIAEENTRVFDTVVREIPQYNPDEPVMISQGPSMCIFNKENKQEVLYSWLFMQYLLTDGIQIPYSQTEGYAPVTADAQENPEYTDYLANAGKGEAEYIAYSSLPKDQIDKTVLRELKNEQSMYYHVKIAATKLLLDNTENTFVTPVFNGSTSLRNAAGNLIEYVVLSSQNKETVDETYMSELFEKIKSLNRLDDYTSQKTENNIDSPMPAGSLALLISLAVIWCLLGIYGAITIYKKRKTTK